MVNLHTISISFNNKVKALITMLRSNCDPPQKVEDAFGYIEQLMKTHTNKLLLIFMQYVYYNNKFKVAISKHKEFFFLSNKNISKNKNVADFMNPIKTMYLKSSKVYKKKIFLYMNLLLFKVEEYYNMAELDDIPQQPDNYNHIFMSDLKK